MNDSVCLYVLICSAPKAKGRLKSSYAGFRSKQGQTVDQFPLKNPRSQNLKKEKRPENYVSLTESLDQAESSLPMLKAQGHVLIGFLFSKT